MQLKQRRSPFTVTHFELKNHLHIREKSLLRSVEIEVDLRRIAAAPLRIKEAPVRWIVGASLFTLLALFSLYEAWGAWDSPATVGLVFTGGIALACWFNSWKLHRNILVFRDRGTQQPAFFMLRSSPSSQEVDAFVEQIAAQVDRPLPPLGANHGELIAHHAQVLQYLLEAGVLLAEEHRSALARLQRTSSKGSVVSLVHSE